MAIKSNKKVDFEYEYVAPSGALYTIALRFHYTEEYGPTIGILDDNEESAINFPVTMFSEVCDFLVEQGILSGKKQLPMSQIPTKQLKPAATTKQAGLPKPKLVSSATVNPVKIGNKTKNAVEVDLADEDEVEQPFLPEDLIRKEQERLDAINAGIEGTVPTQSLSSVADQSDLSQEEIEEIIAQRAAAVKKAKGKSIRRTDE